MPVFRESPVRPDQLARRVQREFRALPEQPDLKGRKA